MVRKPSEMRTVCSGSQGPHRTVQLKKKKNKKKEEEKKKKKKKKKKLD